MIINYWTNFHKRKNSTKRPSGGNSIDVRLKQDTSIENPSFIVSGGIINATYVQVPEWGEYYFVTDVVNLTNNMCEIVCACDPMANLKGAIGDTYAFVLYDTTRNKYLPDTRLACMSEPMIASSGGVNLDHFSATGTIILTCTNEGGCGTYAIPTASLPYLIPNDIQDQVDASALTFIEDSGGVLHPGYTDATGLAIWSSLRELVASGKAIDNIQDIRWIPFNVIDLPPSDQTEIYLGKYDTHITGQPISQGASRVLLGGTGSVSIPWRYDDWRNAEPYTQLYISIPFVGTINIPASTLIGKSTIRLDYSIDKVSGDIAYQLWAGNADFLIGTYGASTAVKVPIGSSMTDIVDVISRLTEASTSVLVGNYPGAVGQAINAFVPTPQTVGGLGTSASTGLPQQFKIWSVVHKPIADPDSVVNVIGSPTYMQKKIGTLSGYVQCSGASVSANCRQSEREIVDGYLNSGFFYE